MKNKNTFKGAKANKPEPSRVEAVVSWSYNLYLYPKQWKGNIAISCMLRSIVFCILLFPPRLFKNTTNTIRQVLNISSTRSSKFLREKRSTLFFIILKFTTLLFLKCEHTI